MKNQAIDRRLLQQLSHEDDLFIVQASVLLKKERKVRRDTREKILGKDKKQNLCLFSVLSGRGVDFESRVFIEN